LFDLAAKSIEKIRDVWAGISTQKQLLLLGLVSIAALVTFTAWVFVDRTQAEIDHSVEQFGMAMAQALACGGAEALHNSSNLEELKHYVLTEMGETPAIAYVVFADKSGQIIFDSQSLADRKKGLPAPSESSIYPIYRQIGAFTDVAGVYPSPHGYRPLMNIAVPMRRKAEMLGMCWVGLDSHDFTILGTPRETRDFLVSIFSLVGVLGALGLAVHYALINRPLSALSEAAGQIAYGRFGHQLELQQAGREIDQVVKAFNYMSNRLEQYDKQNVDSLMAERNKLELVLMSIADGVVVCDRDNKVQIVNAAATQLFAKDATELLGKPLVFCTEGPESPQICQVIQAFTDSISPGSQDAVVQQIHLAERTVRLNIAPLVLKNEFLGSVMIMQDITRQAELERMKNEFISNVSHELRTPITSIKSYVDTLCNHGEKLEPEIYTEFLHIIDNEADRLSYLVNEVLELSRVEEGEAEADMAPQQIRSVMDYAMRAVNLMASDRQIGLTLEMDPVLPLVNINQESIERVVINLLTNAIKYTPVGGTIKLAVSNLPDERKIRVSIIDNGIGIPEESLPHIFDRFYRVERKVHTIKGTGLGLTIVKRIVEGQGGTVLVQSALGHGSTFSFFLPWADVQGTSKPNEPVSETRPEGKDFAPVDSSKAETKMETA
jgi:two-component system sensor histidine kinase NblS